jgi:hypothetical protein
MKTGSAIPPIEGYQAGVNNTWIIQDGKGLLFTTEGHHRIEAARISRHTHIPVVYKPPSASTGTPYVPPHRRGK